MQMTLTQKILAKHSNLDVIKPGELIMSDIDMVLGNDVTTPVAIIEFEKHGFKRVFDNKKIAIVLDHYTPCKDINSAKLCKIARDFANKHDIINFYDIGKSGIEHALLPEKGLVKPMDVIIGADSHTCTYGALGAFSTGIGSTDMAAGMVSGKAWFKVPSAIKVVLKGNKSKYISGKDIILYLIGKIGVDGALYKSLEFCGDAVKQLTIDDRFTICNMAIEAGAKNGIFPVDDITINYLMNKVTNKFEVLNADSDAIYDEIIEINLDKINPIVALPHLPSNIKSLEEDLNINIDQVVIGSCTNGRYSDLLIASKILKNNHIKKGLRCIVIPATQEIYRKCIKNGLIDIFIDSGCVVSTPTCGPCLGGHMGVLANGEIALSTTNRNFVGRMGDIDSKIILSSPLVAAVGAIIGKVPTVNDIKKYYKE